MNGVRQIVDDRGALVKGLYVPEAMPTEWDRIVLRAYELGNLHGAEGVRRPIIDALKVATLFDVDMLS